MATKPSGESILTGRAQQLAGLPRAATPQGGVDNAFDGATTGRPRKRRQKITAADTQNPMLDTGLPDDESDVFEPNGADDAARATQVADAPPAADDGNFTGMGPWLEGSAAQVFSTADELVMRQEIPALNHLALDTHFARVKQGYAFSSLEKDDARGTYRSSLPVGTNSAVIQAVPNKTWDLCNKATETVLSDFAQPRVTPINNSQTARAATKVAQRFLDQNGGENGSNDIRLFFNALDRALVCSSAYIERWTDPAGGGSRPLQILAHPQATDPANPMLGPDGMPTTDPVLRYVTAPDGGQFTDDPLQAAPEWQPKIRASLWGREHIRVFPEQYPVDEAEKVILLTYCTIGEAKRRWPAVAAMDADEINVLIDWTPPRFLVLLPAFQRVRFQSSAGKDKEQQGTSDERILFFYHLYAKSGPANKRGADVVVSGANSGTILHRQTLSAELPGPSDATEGQPHKIVRCIDIPVTQLTPRADPDGRDPSGMSYLWLFAGAVEFDAALMTAFLEMVGLWVHPDSYQPSTSPVQADQIAHSRLTGEPIPILRPEDKPVYGNQPVLPNSFWQSIEHNASSIESIASMTKPLTGSDRQPEVSGKARQIAVQQAMVGLSRMQHPVNAARVRDARICLELAMRDFSTAQVMRYLDDGGTWEAQDWTGEDFAQVGGVELKLGTGTMLTSEAKVNYLGNLQSSQLISPQEAQDAARSSYAPSLGLSDSAHMQYVERCIKTWLDGPPEGWKEQWAAHKQALQQWEQHVQQIQQAQMQQEQRQQDQQMQTQQDQQMQRQRQEQQAQADADDRKTRDRTAADARAGMMQRDTEERQAERSADTDRLNHQRAMEMANLKAQEQANLKAYDRGMEGQ